MAENNVENQDVEQKNVQVKPTKASWIFGPLFLLFWLGLFFAVVMPLYLRLPATKSVLAANSNGTDFIAERALENLYKYDQIGIKLAGTKRNDVQTVQFLVDEITKIRDNMRKDLYDLEIDVQVVSGEFPYKGYLSAYKNMQNVVVKFNTKNNTNQNYLLVNSHFDSKPFSPGTGDDGTMVVNMLEILRVLSTHTGNLKHPIIFLFNGAEELNMRGSHGFITTHKWAKNVAALINLECSGSGNRELLFQHSANNSWLIKYYKKHAKHPYGYVIAEELFQSGILPSDTDFYIFRNFGNIPGLDFAYTYNGYVYHTIFDTYDVVPGESLQNTGDNILSLVKGLANAPELDNIENVEDDNLVFFDFMGLFFVYYTTSLAQIINIAVALCSIFVAFLTAINIKHNFKLTNIITEFGIIFVLHLIGVVLAIVLPVGIGYVVDAYGLVLSWYTSLWLVIGLHMAPALFGLFLPTMIYLKNTKNSKISVYGQIHLILNSHGILLSILLIAGTLLNIKSSFIILAPLIFYVGMQIINIIWSEFNSSEKVYYSWNITIFLSQILPFLLLAFIYKVFLVGLVPIFGRIGTSTNVDLVLAFVGAFFAILLLGFVVPLLNATKRSGLVLFTLLITTVAFVVISQKTNIGFPFRPKTNTERVTFQTVHRVFYEHDGAVVRNDSGFYFLFDHRREREFLAPYANFTKLQSTTNCAKNLYCDLPVYNYMWQGRIEQSAWLPLDKIVTIPFVPKLELLKRNNTFNNTVQFRFKYTGSNHVGIILQPKEAVTVTDWSFSKSFLKTSSPYFVGIAIGKDAVPVEFTVEVQKLNGSLKEPLFELAVASHFISDEYKRDAATIAFKNRFPSYAFVLEWPSSYQRYIF